MKPAGPGGAPAAEGGGGGGVGQAPGLPALSPSAAGPAWEQVVHSRSQALLRGSPALGDALKQLVPRSTAFMSSEAELWDFLCSLRHEFSPVILRSKDVYGYASCRAVVPERPRGWPEEEAAAAAAGTSRRSRRGGKAPAAAAAKAKGKRPATDAKSRRGGKSAKPAAKKRKENGRMPSRLPRELWPCDKRPIPSEPLPDPEIPLSAFPPVKVRGDIWERRSLEAARRRAQRLWRVDLAPVVKLRRLPAPLGC